MWTHPSDRSDRYNTLDYWVELARLLERGRFDALFLADVLGVYDVYRGSPDAAIANATQVPVNDPLLVVHCLYFLPLPQGQGSFRPILAISATSIGRRDPCTESCWAMPGFMTFCSPSIAILRRAAEREARHIDETLFFDLYAATQIKAAGAKRR